MSKFRRRQTLYRGVVIKKIKGGSDSLTVGELALLCGLPWTERGGVETAVYVRAECLGHGDAAAWTQPFWIVE